MELLLGSVDDRLGIRSPAPRRGLVQVLFNQCEPQDQISVRFSWVGTAASTAAEMSTLFGHEAKLGL